MSSDQGGPNATDPKDLSPRAITRRDFEAVIRRATELSATESERNDELLSEEEVIRIATELGLPDRYVRQALFELPQIDTEEGGRGTYFPEPVLTATRVVPGHATDLLRRIEDYLSTREYLQVIRRRADRSFLMPAEDAISGLARGLLRPSSRYYLSRARRVILSARSIDEKTSHIQIALDLSEQRKHAMQGGWIGGSFAGLFVGGGIAVGLAFVDMPAAIHVASQIAGFAAGFAGTLAGVLTGSRAAYRRQVAGARFELDGLLDRAEHGQSLEPPPAPWRKRLQQKLLGHG